MFVQKTERELLYTYDPNLFKLFPRQWAGIVYASEPVWFLYEQ